MQKSAELIKSNIESYLSKNGKEKTSIEEIEVKGEVGVTYFSRQLPAKYFRHA